jgi:hypothetical protein
MGRDEGRGPDAEHRDADHPPVIEGDTEERAERDTGQVDTAHEDVIPFDKESRLDELDPRD